MKRLWLVVLSLVLFLCFGNVACGGGDAGAPADGTKGGKCVYSDSSAGDADADADGETGTATAAATQRAICRARAVFCSSPAPAPLCADGPDAPDGQVLCQVLEAPESARRLVPDASFAPASRDGEIRLTYGQLTALIADAVRTLKD